MSSSSSSHPSSPSSSASPSAPTHEPPSRRATAGRWASLADRLNPNRAAFDPALKSSWKSMSKIERKRMIADDRRAIAALRKRGASSELPFDAEPDDHCETSPTAYGHVAPVLRFLAERLGAAGGARGGAEAGELRIYDPYYCAGGAARRLNDLGFANVYNRCEDFYETIAKGRVPEHDVVVTNPPYSGDHFHRLLAFLRENGRPALLLLPEHFSRGKSALYSEDEFCFLCPPERYHYWTPEGMRPDRERDGERGGKRKRTHRNLVLGSRNSPFASHWFLRLGPTIDKDEFVSLVDEGVIRLAEGCTVHNTQRTIRPTSFKGVVSEQNGGDEMSAQKKRRKRRKKKKKRTADDDTAEG